MAGHLSRRAFLAGAAGAGALASTTGGAAPAAAAAKTYQNGASPWPLVLNASTVRPAPLSKKISAAADAGWDGIELWIDDLEKHEAEGGDLKALAAEIRDRGLYVPNIIGLWGCMPSTREEWEASLPATRERMRRSAAVGSEFVAAIPAPDRADFDLKWGTDRYRDLMKIGREDYGIKVAVEFVGFMKGVHRLGQACAIALDTDDPAACIVADTFHLFRGGSGYNGLRHLQGEIFANFHWNDVPGDVPREEQGDEHRLYPGDGVLPLGQVLRDLKAIGYTRCLSLEIFKREYWEMDPDEVARTGLRKMLDCVAAAGVA
ncbi:MAG: sugar phosphate isomerase/epimerase [Candidatus Hydrogenedens sp.]|nr:sugar phosphate isomerase/epimerase [Candidatus Hydrogenedentota bacterium]NLF56458.1 sugar phosphate isomerase/epimerase [Candidatus Hydrogenedens sp.]